MSKKKQIEPILSWEIDSPVISSSLVWFQTALVVGSGAGFVFLLLVGLNLYERHWDQIPDSFQVGFFLFLGMFLLFALVMLLMFSRGAATRYEVSAEGIVQQTLRKRSRWFKWLGFLGIFSGTGAGYTAAGAALLSDARETIYLKWDEITGIESNPEKGEIILKDNWHIVMQVFASHEAFDAVKKQISDHITKNSTEILPEKKETPFTRKIMLSFFALLFGFFLLPELPIRVVPVFTLLLMLFVLFSLWSTGTKRLIFSLLSLLLSIGLPAIAAFYDGVHLQRDGAGYALALELFFYLYLAAVALYGLRRK